MKKLVFSAICLSGKGDLLDVFVDGLEFMRDKEENVQKVKQEIMLLFSDSDADEFRGEGFELRGKSLNLVGIQVGVVFLVLIYQDSDELSDVLMKLLGSIDFHSKLLFRQKSPGDVNSDSQEYLDEFSKLNNELINKQRLLEQQKQKIKKKNEELEKFNKMMTGREVKMTELKEEIKSLEKKLKQMDIR